ncbi:MAG: hypothetical protein DYG90_04655 [Chloroflexi bacterium CFX6]|nr:hypothetical protein [Chloroflexi bacterium CFX6]
MNIAPFLDAATAERYRITPSGSHGYAVEWFGRAVYFHRNPTAERNWYEAVTWCEQVREMLAADGGAA